MQEKLKVREKAHFTYREILQSVMDKPLTSTSPLYDSLWTHCVLNCFPLVYVIPNPFRKRGAQLAFADLDSFLYSTCFTLPWGNFWELFRLWGPFDLWDFIHLNFYINFRLVLYLIINNTNIRSEQLQWSWMTFLTLPAESLLPSK